jgi:hypothetical protein
MAKNCEKHFKCVSKDDFKGLTSVIALGIFTGSLIIIEIVAAVIAGVAIPGLGVVSGVLFVVAIFELCAFLHGGKLICIEENACTIGRIMEFIPVGQDKSGFEKMDDDFTMNILPSPHSPVELLSEMVMSDPYQGPFMVEQSQSADLGLGFAGVSVKFDAIPQDTEVFHVEVKGCRVHDVCAVLKVMSFGAPIVGAICSIPLIGWVVCLIAAAIWLAITAAAVAIAWAATHNGDINDVYDPAAGELTAADATTGEGGDVILVSGDWVYDAGHSGWNEIHPIRHVQKLTPEVDARFRGMGKADPMLVEAFKTEVLDVWCFHVGESRDPLVIAAQQEPENQWHIHPLIDGCQDDVIE